MLSKTKHSIETEVGEKPRTNRASRHIILFSVACAHGNAGSAASLRFFEEKNNSGMYIVFIVRLNNTVLASTADRLISDNLFMLLLSNILLLILFQ